jgi:hypothetical protein
MPDIPNNSAFDIKASLVIGNPLFYKSLKQSNTEAPIPGFLPFLGPEKDFLFVRHENSFVLYFINDIYMHHVLYIFYQLHKYPSFEYRE